MDRPPWLKRSVASHPTGICPPAGPCPHTRGRHGYMVVVGIDAHKRTHTAVIVDEQGRQLAARTFQATSAGHLGMLRWAAGFGEQRQWAVEDCRNMTRRLERDLLGAGEHLVRVPPKLMAAVRRSARSYGKSDPIDAL